MGKFTLSLSECPRQFWNPSLPRERARFDWQFGHHSPGKTVKQRHNLRLLFVRPLSGISAFCLKQKKPRRFWDIRGFCRDPDAPA
jgi:hypothetical protein